MVSIKFEVLQVNWCFLNQGHQLLLITQLR